MRGFFSECSELVTSAQHLWYLNLHGAEPTWRPSICNRRQSAAAGHKIRVVPRLALDLTSTCDTIANLYHPFPAPWVSPAPHRQHLSRPCATACLRCERADSVALQISLPLRLHSLSRETPGFLARDGKAIRRLTLVRPQPDHESPTASRPLHHLVPRSRLRTTVSASCPSTIYQLDTVLCSPIGMSQTE